ncbi:MAG TPA: putative baseplate assembly protein [Ktedonobacteraceae bacterium]|nr:putative baseplate assembly protein [Ktedonobacteraceae bacterium]
MEEQQEKTPEIDYLSKDYASFRRLMLDHLAQRVPGWQEPTEADIGNVMVEILAYAGDYLSYYQDAVATEAYLGTARLRTSVRRHARLLDYMLSEGCNARVWLCFEVDEPVLLPKATPVLSRTGGTEQAPVVLSGSSTYYQIMQANPKIFETMHDAALYPAHSAIALYAEKDTQTIWPAGSTTATLLDPGYGQEKRLRLRAGDVLIFEEIKNAETGEQRWPDPTQRCAVRLTKATAGVSGGQHVLHVEWAEEDAFPFPLRLAVWFQDTLITDISVARGNVVLADHGNSIRHELLPAVPADPQRRYRPYLLVADLTHATSYSHDAALTRPASLALVQDVYHALPQISLFQYSNAAPFALSKDIENELRNSSLYLSNTAQERLQEQSIVFSQHVAVRAVSSSEWELYDIINRQYWLAALKEGAMYLYTFRRWSLRRDLLNSGSLDYDFTVDMEDDRRARVRFGFGQQGRQPLVGNRFEVTYRVGEGVQGNVKAETLTHVVTDRQGISRVRNPLPAQGGTAPEAIADAGLNAPFAFTAQQRCVINDDYARMAEAHPEVAKAVVEVRWMGGWHTAFIYVQRSGALAVDAAFKREIARYMQRYLVSGHEVEIRTPRFVALQIVLNIYLKPHVSRNQVRNTLLQAFGTQPGGFFYPGNFTFGQALYQSQVVRRAADVPGVARVEAAQFCRADAANTDMVYQHILTKATEIIRLDSDKSAPQNGTITFTMEGGL